MDEEDLKTIISLFYEMYQPHTHMIAGGYAVDNKDIVIFVNKRTGRQTHVYLHAKKSHLMPYFPK
jgi:hypothetical protein